MRRAALLAGLVLLLAPAVALAQGPFGIGTPEPSGAAWAGPFAPLFDQIAAWQGEFYAELTDAIGDLKEDGGAIWLLAGVAFLYGIFHAAGPGHGKAVISAYLLASGETLKRGIVIAFAAAFVQALVAIVLVAILAGILNVTASTMTDATDALEIGSYALIVIVGLWLLWARISGRGHHHHQHHAHDDHDHHQGDHHEHAAQPAEREAPHGREACPPALATASYAYAGAVAGGGNAGPHDHDAHEHHAGDHHGHHHAPDPALMAKPLTWRSAWTAIFAVGIRPCSGAVILLVFALAQGLFAAGIAATFVMAVGTAITVSALAALAVLARDYALRLSGGSGRFGVVLRVIEILAAAAVLALGLLLLGGARSR